MYGTFQTGMSPLPLQNSHLLLVRKIITSCVILALKLYLSVTLRFIASYAVEGSARAQLDTYP